MRLLATAIGGLAAQGGADSGGGPAQPATESDPTFSLDGLQRFRLLETAASHAGCMRACEALNSSLACIDSRENSDVLASASAGPGANVWFSMYQFRDTGGPRGWHPAAAGCNASYANWAERAPCNCHNLKENCAAFQSDGRWSASPCHVKLPCLCERAQRTRPHYWRAMELTRRDEWGNLVLFLGLLSVVSVAIGTGYSVWCLHQGKDAGGRGVYPRRPRHLGLHTRASVVDTLHVAGRAGRTLRARVQGLLQACGFILMAWGFTPSVLFSLGTWPATHAGSFACFLPLILAGTAFVGLSVRPTDATTIRLFACVACTSCIFLAAASSLTMRSSVHDLTLRVLFLIATLVSLLALPLFSYTLCIARHRPRQALQLLWCAIRLAYGTLGALTLAYFPIRQVQPTPLICSYISSYLSIYLYVYLSTYLYQSFLSNHPSTFLPLSIYLSTLPSIHISHIYLSIFRSVATQLSSYIYLSIHPSIHLHLSIYLIYLSNLHTSIPASSPATNAPLRSPVYRRYLSIYLSISIHPSIHPSIQLYLSVFLIYLSNLSI